MAPPFWVDGMNCANYIQNQIPSRAMLHMTLDGAWSHLKPNVSTFSVFSSQTWPLILNEKRKSMEKKIQPLIFVGYYGDMKECRLFDPISKDVLFQRLSLLMSVSNTHVLIFPP